VSVQAHPYFTGNPYAPVPPSCITEAHDLPLAYAALNGVSVVVWEGKVSLDRVDSQETYVPQEFAQKSVADLSIYRVACAEPGRSALVADFRVPEDAQGAPSSSRYITPQMVFDTNGWGGNGFALVSETVDWHPAGGEFGFGDFLDRYDGIGWFGWTYVLDVFEPPWDGYWPITAENYNSAFALSVSPSSDYINVPATREALDQMPRLPLNGRLSGTWVVEGARDQGLILSFSNPVPSAGQVASDPKNSPILIFLTWYTFDPEGRMLWLSGSAAFEQGATEVDVPIVLTGNGEFLGGKLADRSTAGLVRLSSMSCNDLRLDYDLANLSLGIGTGQLRRLYSLEVAGDNCRDYEARQQTLTDDHLQRNP
jgi:hypothetical protein